MPRWPSYDKHVTLITKTTTNQYYLYNCTWYQKYRARHAKNLWTWLLKQTKEQLLIWCKRSRQGRIHGGRAVRSPHPEPSKVTLFTIIFCNSEKNIRDIRSLGRPLFCQSSVVEYSSSLVQSRGGYETWLPNITEIFPLKRGGWISPVQQSQSNSRMFRTGKTILWYIFDVHIKASYRNCEQIWKNEENITWNAS